MKQLWTQSYWELLRVNLRSCNAKQLKVLGLCHLDDRLRLLQLRAIYLLTICQVLPLLLSFVVHDSTFYFWVQLFLKITLTMKLAVVFAVASCPHLLDLLFIVVTVTPTYLPLSKAINSNLRPKNNHSPCCSSNVGSRFLMI